MEIYNRFRSSCRLVNLTAKLVYLKFRMAQARGRDQEQITRRWMIQSKLSP